MNATDHPLVAAYLDSVARETAELPADRRAELLADLREHIEVSEAQDDAGIRAVLAELGEPRTVAASALAEEGPQTPATAPAPAAAPAPTGPLAGRQAARLVAALPALGGLTVLAQPVLGALVLAIGLALLWMSPLWTTRHKRIGTATAVAVPVVLLLGGLMLAGGRIGPLELLLIGVFLVAVPAVGAAVLLRALRD
ncbi:hypothetical protein GCM10017562_71200 [Streptomyces roseofulvus]|uniref:HAAS signaling domain-containing protein n=1 Tax=Streptomyces roseofulvus TaxID=33902 RepID=UPI0031FCDD98